MNERHFSTTWSSARCKPSSHLCSVHRLFPLIRATRDNGSKVASQRVNLCCTSTQRVRTNKEHWRVGFLRVVFIRSIRQPAVESLRCARSVSVFVFLKALLALMMSAFIAAHKHTSSSQRRKYPLHNKEKKLLLLLSLALA